MYPSIRDMTLRGMADIASFSVFKKIGTFGLRSRIRVMRSRAVSVPSAPPGASSQSMTMQLTWGCERNA